MNTSKPLPDQPGANIEPTQSCSTKGPPPSRYGVVEFYTSQGSEKERFNHPRGEIEFVRTCSILERHLPKNDDESKLILDIGGGPGNYSKWLLERDYQVKLLDLVPRLVDEAAKLFEEFDGVGSRAQAQVGSAVNLPFADCSADSVLLMGPLYHLTEYEDRHKALLEAFRVLKPGAKLFAAGISRFASLFDGLDLNFLFDDPVFEEILRRDLSSGQHRNPTDNPEYFTDCFFHHPDELASEVRTAGFRDVRVLAVEGPALLNRNLSQNWQDKKHRELLLEMVQQVEEEPTLLGMSSHLLVVAKKP